MTCVLFTVPSFILHCVLPHPYHLSPSVPQACERDMQCGFGLCCAVSLWLRGLRMCVPRGVEGDECHPFSHKVWGNATLLTHSVTVTSHALAVRLNSDYVKLLTGWLKGYKSC